MLLGRNVVMDVDKSQEHINGYDQNHRKRTLNGQVAAGDEKWRPFWQRGQTTYEEMKEMSRNRRPVTQRTKLHHSNMDLSSAGRERKKAKMSKSASVQGLNHYPRTDRSRDNRHMGILSRNNSHLILPQIEPDVEINDRHGSRGSSAHMSAHSSRHSAASGNREPLQIDESPVEDGDIYESDDDPVISRQNLDKAGDYIVEHDWILKGKIANEARKVKVLHHKVKIPLPDDDPLETIKSRMDEINMMVKPRAEYGNFLDTIDPEQKARIMKYKFIDHKDILAKRRANWKPIDRFKDAVSKVLIQHRAAYPRRRYIPDGKTDSSPDGIKKYRQDKQADNDPLKKSSLGYDMQLALATQPMFRTDDDVKRVTQILRATKAFKHLFPAQLEARLARVVAYERYDDKRIIAQQGRVAERFYYILTGKVDKVREYRLMSGIVTRVEGCIEKGNTTDPQEMSENWLRDQDLVAKGHVEVLILDKKDFNDLLHTCKGPPIDFLQGLDLFKEFPCEVFRYNPEAIDFRYYGQEKLLVKDSNRTPWLHVVKTGHVKVVRMQTVIDIHNEDKFSGQTTEELGCVRPFSHANAMLGVLAKQRKQKTILGAISFPEVTQRPVFERSKTDYNWSEKSRAANLNKNAKFENPLTRMYRPALLNLPNSTSSDSPPNSSRSGSKIKQKISNSPTPENVNSSGTGDVSKMQSSSSRLANIKEDNEPGSAGGFDRKGETPKLTITSPTLKPSTPVNGRSETSSRKQSLSFLPPINNERKSNNEFVPHGTYLTREKTEAETNTYRRKAKKEATLRETYLQLDLLKPGDIFGLEHMEPQALASEAPGVTLISDGAEIIKISKRFFLQHAKNNTMLKVETMQREYMTQEEAKTVMYDKETWQQYKSVLLQRTVGNLHRTQFEKVP